MKTIFILLGLLSSVSFAITLRIHNPVIASQAAFTSADFNNSIPFWIWKGQLIDLKKANEIINDPTEFICSLWIMDWTEEKNLTKENLKSKLLLSVNSLDLWKRISGKTIFTNSMMDASLSYACVQKTTSGEIKEIDFLNDEVFNDVFRGVVEIFE